MSILLAEWAGETPARPTGSPPRVRPGAEWKPGPRQWQIAGALSLFLMMAIAVSSLGSHGLAQITQLFVNFVWVEYRAPDLFPQNGAIPRTQTCYIAAQR